MTLTPHDFTKPTRLSPDWHLRLSAWCQTAASLANKAAVKKLATPVEASIENVDVCYGAQAMARLTDDTLPYRIKVGDRVVSILLVPRMLMLNLVGILLGDSAAAADDRELTLIEEKLADFFLVHHWLAFFRESWPGASSPSWVLEERLPTMQCKRAYAPEEVLIAVDWQMQGPWGKAAGAWFFAKKGLIDVLTNPNSAAQDGPPEIQVAIRREAIVYQLPVPVEVVLGSAELRLSELSSLQVGDVVLLDQRAADGVLARAGGQDLFRGQAGRLGSWKAFQIQTNAKK